jgi:hypothetical protein
VQSPNGVLPDGWPVANLPSDARRSTEGPLGRVGLPAAGRPTRTRTGRREPEDRVRWSDSSLWSSRRREECPMAAWETEPLACTLLSRGEHAASRARR